MDGFQWRVGVIREKGQILTSGTSLSCPCDKPEPAPAFQYNQPPEGETRFDWRGKTYQRGYKKCRNCGHWHAAIEMDLTDFYRGGYVDGTYGNRLKENFQRILSLPENQSDNEARVKRVLDFAIRKWGKKKAPNLLDVGSGLAVFPFRMKEAGWRVTALDPDERAAEHARENAGVKSIHADFLQWKPETGERFDVITLNKVLEHVEEPITMMVHARKWVRPWGFLYIEVPDVTAAQEGPGREEFFIEHLHVFSKSSLGSVAQKAGWGADSVLQLQERSGKFSLCAFFRKNEKTC